MKALTLVLLVGSLAAVGCGKKQDDAQIAAEQAAKAMQQMQTATTNADGTNKKPGVAVPAKTLAGFLPTSIPGYTLEGDPETMEMDMQGAKYTHAQGTYKNGDKRIQVSIFDYNYIAGLSMAYSAMLNMNLETNEESFHSEKMSGFPGWIQWKKKSNEGSIGVVVNDRIFVVTQANNGVTIDEAKNAANAVNYSGIASAAK